MEDQNRAGIIGTAVFVALFLAVIAICLCAADSASDLLQECINNMQSGNYRQAIKDCDKAIELNPQYAAYGNRGVVYFLLGDYHQAIKDYEKVIELSPKDAKAYGNRAVAYFQLGEYHQAIRDWDKAVELNPHYAAAYYCRGLAYVNLDNPRQAIEDFRTAAQLGSEQAQDFLRSQGISW